MTHAPKAQEQETCSRVIRYFTAAIAPTHQQPVLNRVVGYLLELAYYSGCSPRHCELLFTDVSIENSALRKVVKRGRCGVRTMRWIDELFGMNSEDRNEMLNAAFHHLRNCFPANDSETNRIEHSRLNCVLVHACDKEKLVLYGYESLLPPLDLGIDEGDDRLTD